MDTAKTICAALALAAAMAAQAAAPGDRLPDEQAQGSVHYRSGGIGSDEAKAMKKEMARYPLALEFVAKTGTKGELLAEIPVTITDSAARPVLKVVSDGPFLLVKLQPGKYRVVADYDGKSQRRTIAVPAKGSERVVFEWTAA
jgi:hypothetical protein